MIPIFVLIALISYFTNTVCVQHKYTIAELSEGEKNVINSFRNRYENVEYNQNLIKIAQNEADRLSQNGILTPPSMNLLGGKNFFGYSWKFTGMKPDNSSRIFLKICYNNFLKDSTNNRIFTSEEDDSMCPNLNILNKYITAVGYGVAVDSQGNGYSVRLFSTNQKSNLPSRSLPTSLRSRY